MRHRVLHDESFDPLRMCQSHAKTYRAAVVLHVKRVARQPERFREVIHDLGAVIERIREVLRVRPIAMSEARIIRRDKVIAIGKPREQRFEHARGRRQSVQQQKRRRIFRASLSVKNGEPINLHRAIKSRVFHLTFLSLSLVRQLSGSAVNFEKRGLCYPATSKMISSSTGVPSGRLATPYTKRQGFFSLPKTSCSNSEAPSAIFGCSRKSPEVAMDPLNLTVRVNLSSDPKCCRATARPFSAARRAAWRPASTSSSAPTRPMNFAVWPSVASMPVRKSRFPVCTASVYMPKGFGGAGSLMPSSFNRCSALAGREPSRVTICQRARRHPRARFHQRLLASSAPSVSPPRGATPSVAPASPALRDTTC